MKIATLLRSVPAVMALAILVSAPAHAQMARERVLGFAGSRTVSLGGGTVLSPNIASALPPLYDNTASPALGGISSTDLAAVWGDELVMTGPGVLDSHTFTLYNSGASAGPLVTATISLAFFDAPSLTPLGGYNVNLNLGGGIPAGFYTLITVPNLAALNINLTADVVCLQSVSAVTGGATRLGVVLLDPVTVGSSPPTMYINASTIGAAGWYSFSGVNANPGYQIVPAEGPTPTQRSTWGAIKSLYR